MVVILAKRLSSVGKEKVESKNFCLYYRQILQKFKPILILFFPFSLISFKLYTSQVSMREKTKFPTHPTIKYHSPTQTYSIFFLGRCPLVLIKLFLKNWWGYSTHLPSLFHAVRLQNISQVSELATLKSSLPPHST